MSSDRDAYAVSSSDFSLEPAAEGRYRGMVPMACLDEASLQAIRVFQAVLRNLIATPCGGRGEMRPGSDDRWWRLLAEVSGLPTAFVSEGRRPRHGSDDPIFRFDPTPDALAELAIALTELADAASESDPVDQVAFAILRSVERHLAREGLGGAYSAAVERTRTQASNG